MSPQSSIATRTRRRKSFAKSVLWFAIRKACRLWKANQWGGGLR